MLKAQQRAESNVCFDSSGGRTPSLSGVSAAIRLSASAAVVRPTLNNCMVINGHGNLLARHSPNETKICIQFSLFGPYCAKTMNVMMMMMMMI